MAVHEARYRYRLRVNTKEADALKGVFDSCRFVWNQALGRWSNLWRYEGLSLRLAGADKELTDWRSRFEWLAAQPAVPQQQVLRDLFASISAFFAKKNPAGRPRFKKRRASYAIARWTKNGFKVGGTGLGRPGDRLEVATAGRRLPLRVVWSRPLPSAPTSVTIYSDKAGLVLGRDRNAARNLNPDRTGTPVGGAEPAGVAVPVGDDGNKPKVPTGTVAA
jgi:putative transposase